MSETLQSGAVIDGNAYELNKGDVILFFSDISSSMNEKDCPGRLSRIEYLKEQLKVYVTEASKFDPDSRIHITTFGSEVHPQPDLTVEQALKLIDGLKANEGTTNTARAINEAWRQAKELRKKGVTDNIVAMIVTDGEPTGSPTAQDDVKVAIRNIANSLENRLEFGIAFLTIGEISSSLEKFLEDIDSNLGAKLDIVTVKEFHKVDFQGAFMSALSE